MDCSQKMTGIEMLGGATDNKVMSISLTKEGKNPEQAILSDFKKKLESLTAEQPAAVAAQLANVMTDPVAATAVMLGQDPSMVMATSAPEVPSEVVGILEGFGLLDYQTDIGEATDMPGLQPEVSSAPDEAAQQAPVTDSIAGMLQNEKPGEAARNAAAQTDAGTDGYSGSLENTSNAAEDGAAMATETDAVTLLKTKTKVENNQSAEVAPEQNRTQAEASARNAGQPASAEAPDAAVKALDDSETQPSPDSEVSVAPQYAAGPETAKVAPRTAEASVGTAEPQTSTADFVQDNVIRIVDKAKASIGEGRYEFDVDLKPDFLGKVSIKLTMENGEVRMRVLTEDAGAKGLFTDHSGSLQSALKEKGIVISAVDVSYQEPMATGHEAWGQQTGDNGQRRESVPTRNAGRYASGELFDAAVPVSELLGGSSVEYLA